MYIFTLYTTSLYRLVRSLVFQQPRLVAAVLHGAISGDLLVSGFGFLLADIATGDHPSPLWVGWSLGLARRAVILTLPLLFSQLDSLFLFLFLDVRSSCTFSGSFGHSWYADRGMLLTHLSLESFCSVPAGLPPRSVQSCHPGSSSCFHSFCGNTLCLCSCVTFFFPLYVFLFLGLFLKNPQGEYMLQWIAEKREHVFETLHIRKCFYCPFPLGDY